jgi:hypothetical protein
MKIESEYIESVEDQVKSLMTVLLIETESEFSDLRLRMSRNEEYVFSRHRRFIIKLADMIKRKISCFDNFLEEKENDN